MGYLHIGDLYKNQDILKFKECFAMEKIHGSSAHIGWNKGLIKFFSGGESHERFTDLFDHSFLTEKFKEIDRQKITVYGEVYGGECRGMSATYGKEMRFAAFDVCIGDRWLQVDQADGFCRALKLDFVHWVVLPTDIAILDKERDSNSVQAVKNGILEPRKREGIVLRPPFEVTMNNGERIICKHKRKDFQETATHRDVTDPAKLQILADAEKIAAEWVTEMRLTHVLDKLPQGTNMEATADVIKAMLEDVLRESKNEIVDSKDARKAIGKRTAIMFKTRIKSSPI